MIYQFQNKNYRMKIKTKFYHLLVTFLLTQTVSKAQILQPNNENRHNISLNAGLDNNLLGLTIGYSYYAPKHKSALFIGLNQGSSLLGSGDFRAEIGVNTWQGSFKKFTLKNQLSFVFARSENKAATYNGLGLNLTINPGFKFGKFGVGLDLQLNPFFATHIKHSDFYLQNAFSNAKSGWYSTTAINKRVGFYVVRQFGKQNKLEINLKAGYQNNGIYDKLAPNLYGIVGINKSF